MNLEILCNNLKTEIHSKNEFRVEIYDVDETELLKQIDDVDIIAYVNDKLRDSVLEEIGIDHVKKYFDLTENV